MHNREPILDPLPETNTENKLAIWKSLPSQPSFDAAWDIKERKKEEDYALYEIGGGVLKYYNGGNQIPADAYYFMIEQFKRFSQHPPESDMLEWCWDQAFMYVDSYDPYVLMSGCSDVIKTDEAYQYQYSLSDDGRTFYEVAADEIETFKLWDKGTEAWEILMRHPGLETYFDHFYEYFTEHFDYVKNDDHPECYEKEWALIRKYGPKTQHIAHLGLWAAIMWMSSPNEEAKHWRADSHPIFANCYDTGASVYAGWTFYDSDHHRRIERPPQTCSRCSTDQWCVTLESTIGSYICENCISEGLPFPGMTCGTKACEAFSCPNHPNFSTDLVAAKRKTFQQAADKRFGELQKLEDGSQVRQLPGYMVLQEITMNKYAGQISNQVADKLLEIIRPKGRN